MPLKQGYSEKTISDNIAKMVKEGYDTKQAAAAAYETARKVWKRRNKGETLPYYLKPVKNPVKKKRGRPPMSASEKKKKAASKKTISARSQVTGKPPTKRLKARRAKNVKPGTFPNPIKTPKFYVAYIVDQDGKHFYYHGWKPGKKQLVFDDRPEGALWYRSRKGAIDEVSHIIAKTYGYPVAKKTPVHSQIYESPKSEGGRVNNPVPPSKYAKMKEAIERFREFTGHDPQQYDVFEITPDVALKIGELDGVLYTTIRDGKQESYIHKFKKKSRPLLAVSYDGTQLYILGGGYEFTERGIVDK